MPLKLETLRLLALTATAGIVHLPAAARDATPAELCLAEIGEAAREAGVPAAVLHAIALTETGRRLADGHVHPWPWALNHAGKSMWFPTREEALAYLDATLGEGQRNIDVGCFQLNVRWHLEAFSSADDMIEPARNARYAADYLATLYRRTGDWTAAVAAYHSSDPDLAQAYLDRFQPLYAYVSDMGADETPSLGSDPGDEERHDSPNAYPLLQAGASAGAGSLVPLIALPHPLIGSGAAP